MGSRRFGLVPSILVLLAVVALGVVALAGCGGGGSSGDDNGGTTGSGGEISTAPISLPDEIGGYRELVKAIEAKGSPSKVVESQSANQEKTAEATTAAYSKAFGGAAATYRGYADSELLKLPYAIAVRAEAPGLVIGPVEDPGYLGLANNEREVQSVGEVECQIAWSPPASKGTKPDPTSEVTTNCQRVGSGVSVFVGSAGFEGPSGLKSMAEFTEAAWQSVVGG
jgi:hypothetical protein